MTVAKASLFLVFVVLSCSWGTGPDLSTAQGVYSLELVDGRHLPVPFEAGDCPREFVESKASLAPRTSERRPLYTILIRLRLQCDPTQALGYERGEALFDAGEWSIESGSVAFKSNQGYGPYRVVIEEQPAGDLGPVLTFRFDGRQYTFRRTWISEPGGGHPPP